MAIHRRQPCAWCGNAGRWPDRCTEDDDECREWIVESCRLHGDHRRCSPETCAFALVWWEDIKKEGMAACTSAGAAYAVVGVLTGVAAVHGTGGHLGRAKSLIRSRVTKAAGFAAADSQGKGLVYVVRVDGEFL